MSVLCGIDVLAHNPPGGEKKIRPNAIFVSGLAEDVTVEKMVDLFGSIGIIKVRGWRLASLRWIAAPSFLSPSLFLSPLSSLLSPILSCTRSCISTLYSSLSLSLSLSPSLIFVTLLFLSLSLFLSPPLHLSFLSLPLSLLLTSPEEQA